MPTKHGTVRKFHSGARWSSTGPLKWIAETSVYTVPLRSPLTYLRSLLLMLLDSVNLQGTDWSRGDSSSNCIELALLTLYNHNNNSKGTVNVGCNYYAFRRDLSISLEGELRMQISSTLGWCCSARPTLADSLFIDSSDTWLARLCYKIANLLTNVPLSSFYLAINLFTTFFFHGCLGCGPRSISLDKSRDKWTRRRVNLHISVVADVVVMDLAFVPDSPFFFLVARHFLLARHGLF